MVSDEYIVFFPEKEFDQHSTRENVDEAFQRIRWDRPTTRGKDAMDPHDKEKKDKRPKQESPKKKTYVFQID